MTCLPPIAWPASRSSRFVRALSRHCAVLGLFALATALIFWPWIADPRVVLIGPPEDNLQDLWNSWYAAAGHAPGAFFATTKLRFPEGTPLIYQSFAYPQIAVVVALTRLFGSDLGTLLALQNLTILASFPLAGLGAYALVRHFTRSEIGSLVGGFVFAFNPSHVAQAMHHAHVAQIEFLPFFALAYLLALERRSVAWLAAAAALLALNALSCWYYLFYCAYFIGFHLLYLRLRDGAWPRGWTLGASAAAIAGAVALLSPLLIPMVRAAAPGVYDNGANTYVADLAAFAAFPPEHALGFLTQGLYARLTGYPWEATVYLGLVNLAVLAWFAGREGLRRRSRMFYVVAGMIFFALLACGEALHIAGWVSPLHLPDVALDKLPFFANVRTPSRAIVFVYLFLAIGVGSAVARLWQTDRRRLAAALIALVVADFAPVHLAATPVACAPELSRLRDDREAGFGILNLPVGYAEENAYMAEQICHGRPMAGGNTTREMARTLIYRLAVGDPVRLRAQLAAAHIKYVVLHRRQGDRFAWSADLAPSARFRAAFRVVADGPNLTLLRVY